MVTYSHAIYIDESGNGAPTVDIHRFWVSVAVSVAFDQTQVLNDGVRRMLHAHFWPFVKEIKGSFMPRYLVPTSTVAKVAQDLAALLDVVGAHCWTVASSSGARSPPGFRA